MIWAFIRKLVMKGASLEDGIKAFTTLSAAAKRYWWVKAIPLPIKKQARQNR